MTKEKRFRLLELKEMRRYFGFKRLALLVGIFLLSSCAKHSFQTVEGKRKNAYYNQIQYSGTQPAGAKNNERNVGKKPKKLKRARRKAKRKQKQRY